MTPKYSSAHLANAARETLHAFREQDPRALFVVLQLQARFGLDQPNTIHMLQLLAERVPE